MSDASNRGQGRVSEVDFVALQAGQTVGRYEIVSILGQGGFGITYRARDSQLGRDVAIKEYLPMALAVRQGGTTVLPRSTKVAEDFDWGRDRFVAEGRTLASLQRGPAIVRVFDFIEVNGTAYIVMELLNGETLESRLKRRGKLDAADLDRILWPMLEGLEQVHAAGFLHRDIKPANILLDAGGNPTLIDFGASRAAIAGKTTTMTAIFTPGYAAAEQFTSAKQGPWTDIYGLSATLYHAIAGAPPPSAFDRMLDDTYTPLAKLRLAGVASGLAIGIDAGLAVRASDRPQGIAGWRPVLRQAEAPEADATVLLRSPEPASAPPPVAKRGGGAWIGVAAVTAVLALGGGGYYFANKPPAVDPVAVAETQKAREQLAAAEAAARKAEQDAAGLREEKAVRERHEREEAEQKLAAEDARRKQEADEAQKSQIAEADKQKAEADAAAQRKALEDARKAAEAGEAALRLTVLDRQHIQVALTALGFATGGSDGAFGPRTREMIGAWQKSRNAASTGFLSAADNQALLKDAAPAIAKFDEDQKKLAEAAARPATPPPAAAVLPPPPPTTEASSSADGAWQGTYACEAGSGANVGGPVEAFSIPLRIGIKDGSGSWTNPGARGTRSISVHVSGATAQFTRVINNGQGTAVGLAGQLSGTTIKAAGREMPAGRLCTASLVRLGDNGVVPTPTDGGVAGSGGGGARGRR